MEEPMEASPVPVDPPCSTPATGTTANRIGAVDGMTISNRRLRRLRLERLAQ